MSKKRPKRFYKNVITAPQDDAFTVLLDGRTLKTPGKKTLVAPTQSIANLIAEEWQAQGDHIRPETMPVTRLVNVALELTPKNRPKLTEEARRYAGTDLLCYRDQSGALARHQSEHWDPILNWAASKGMDLKTASGIIAVSQPEDALDTVASYTKKLDDLELTLFLQLTAVFGSAILSLSVLERHLTGLQAFKLSRLDAQWQIQHWGEDEDDKDRTDSIAAEIDALCKILGD